MNFYWHGVAIRYHILDWCGGGRHTCHTASGAADHTSAYNYAYPQICITVLTLPTNTQYTLVNINEPADTKDLQNCENVQGSRVFRGKGAGPLCPLPLDMPLAIRLSMLQHIQYKMLF